MPTISMTLDVVLKFVGSEMSLHKTHEKNITGLDILPVISYMQ